MSGGGYPKFRDGRGVPEICIGVKELMNIDESPPQDHPHVYINIGEADIISILHDAAPLRSSIDAAHADSPDNFCADNNEA